MTATCRYDHIFKLAQDDIRFAVEIQHGERVELGGRAAWQGHVPGAHQRHQSLHDCVIGGVHERIQRERAAPGTVERRIAVGSYHPLLKLKVKMCMT